jgi:hypothetical protein
MTYSLLCDLQIFFEMGSEAPASASIDAHSHLLHSSFQSFSNLQIINQTGCI